MMDALEHLRPAMAPLSMFDALHDRLDQFENGRGRSFVLLFEQVQALVAAVTSLQSLVRRERCSPQRFSEDVRAGILCD